MATLVFREKGYWIIVDNFFKRPLRLKMRIFLKYIFFKDDEGLPIFLENIFQDRQSYNREFKRTRFKKDL